MAQAQCQPRRRRPRSAATGLAVSDRRPSHPHAEQRADYQGTASVGFDALRAAYEVMLAGNLELPAFPNGTPARRRRPGVDLDDLAEEQSRPPRRNHFRGGTPAARRHLAVGDRRGEHPPRRLGTAHTVLITSWSLVVANARSAMARTRSWSPSIRTVAMANVATAAGVPAPASRRAARRPRRPGPMIGVMIRATSWSMMSASMARMAESQHSDDAERPASDFRTWSTTLG